MALETISGSSRSIDDWTTMFQLCLVILPDEMEATKYFPITDQIFKVLGDADCRTAFVVPTTSAVARRILGKRADEVMTFIDPDRSLMAGLGITSLPALVHIRQDTSVGEVAEGWNPTEWQRVAKSIAKAMAWSAPGFKDS